MEVVRGEWGDAATATKYLIHRANGRGEGEGAKRMGGKREEWVKKKSEKSKTSNGGINELT